jgi:hypothetical protein
MDQWKTGNGIPILFKRMAIRSYKIGAKVWRFFGIVVYVI